MAGEPDDDEKLVGTYWDGADQDMQRAFPMLRRIEDLLVALTAAVARERDAREKKARGEQPDTRVGKVMRQVMLDAGMAHSDVDRITEDFFTRMRPNVTPDAVRQAMKRLDAPAADPPAAGPGPARSKRSRMDKKSQ
jgi:hypothetical protein